MKIKIYTGRIKKGRVTVLGKWINGEILGNKDLIVYELIGKAYFLISKENAFKLNKFEVFKSFAENKGCTVDEIMKDILISFSPIEEQSTEGCMEPITDNGFGIYYGYLNKT